jgi:hypothetical protein
MTWESIFRKYCEYAKTILNVSDINTFIDEGQETLFEKIDFFVDGCAFIEDDWKVIDLYTESHDRYDLLLCVLIHEIGHVICWNKYGYDHTEEDAWDNGGSILEQNEIPECFDLVKVEALSSYARIAKISEHEFWG